MSFFNSIVKQAGEHWDKATDHIFIQEMVNNTLNKEVFAKYLIQDYAFVNSFLDLVSYTIAYSRTVEQKNRLANFLAMITSDEDDYFIRSFKALGVKESQYHAASIDRYPAIKGFDEEIRKAIESRKYEHCLTVLVCAESVYCEWASKYEDKTPESFYFNEWIILHNNPYFKSFVSWLKSEVDALGNLPEKSRNEMAQIFSRVCELESRFFDESYK